MFVYSSNRTCIIIYKTHDIWQEKFYGWSHVAKIVNILSIIARGNGSLIDYRSSIDSSTVVRQPVTLASVLCFNHNNFPPLLHFNRKLFVTLWAAYVKVLTGNNVTGMKSERHGKWLVRKVTGMESDRNLMWSVLNVTVTEIKWSVLHVTGTEFDLYWTWPVSAVINCDRYRFQFRHFVSLLST